MKEIFALDSRMPEDPNPALRRIVPGFVGEGLTMLEGPAKTGKSWLALDFALAVATGGSAMGAVPCEQGDAIYLDYENGDARIRARLETLVPGGRYRREWREDLPRLRWFHSELPQLRLTEVLDIWLGRVKHPRLVVVDAGRHFTQAFGYTWRMDHASRDGMLRAFHGVHRWALQNRLAVLCVARTAKGGAGAATSRHFGVADAVLSLRPGRAAHTLHVMGRDVEDRDVALAFDACRFTLAGDADHGRRWGHRAEIVELLAAGGVPRGPSEVAAALGLPVDNVGRTMLRMAKSGEIWRLRRGRYRLHFPSSHPEHAKCRMPGSHRNYHLLTKG